MIRIGYACINTRLPSSSHTTRLDRLTPERLQELIQGNLSALQTILEWNTAHGIRLFRISSGIIPFGSHPANTFPWEQVFRSELEQIGSYIRQNQIRVSMHPGQYTVLNTPRPEVLQASIAELVYHARFLDSLGLDSSHKLILHLGGVYGDKQGSLERFVSGYRLLPPAVTARLVLENDEKSYTLDDALAVSTNTGAPVIFDVFHHGWNPSLPKLSLRKLIERAALTWKPVDGRQKIHYSDQQPGKQPGSHSTTLDLEAFWSFYRQVEDLEIDIMLEVKDKEQSVLQAQRWIVNGVREQIADAKGRMPKHSVRPAMIIELEDLEEKLEALLTEYGAGLEENLLDQ